MITTIHISFPIDFIDKNFLMCSSKEKLFANKTSSDVKSASRSYAVIEADPHELDHIIDLFRWFFPKTRVLECNHSFQHRRTSTETISSHPTPISSIDSDSYTESSPSNVTSKTFRGKVKDYLQRRYLGETDESPIRQETFDQPSSEQLPSTMPFQYPIAEPNTILSATDNNHVQRLPSKRPPLRRSVMIDMEDEINSHDADDYHRIREREQKISRRQRPVQHSYSAQQTTTNHQQHLPLPSHYSLEHEHKPSPMANRLSLPLASHSNVSDSGHYPSPWLRTPTASFYGSVDFQFPHHPEDFSISAQERIAELPTSTKRPCDESNDFTSIASGFKIESQESVASQDLSSVQTCQICQQRFVSHQAYLAHYGTHLENSSENNKLDLTTSGTHCGLRPYSCQICSKRFARSDMLNRHLRLHSGHRPYCCTMCNTHFSRSDHLSTHLRTHTGEKPYLCPHCPYMACRRDMITRHLKTHTKQRRSERKYGTSSFGSVDEY